jgi:hypothetical protein
VGLDDYEGLAAAYPASGYIWRSSTARGQWCTGTIVNYTGATTRLITAAHCVAGFDQNNDKRITPAEVTANDGAGNTLSFQLGNNGNPNGGFGIVQGWYPNTVPNSFVVGIRPDDVAILEINANMAAFGGAIVPYSYVNPANLLGFQADFVGWGDQGTGSAASNAAGCQDMATMPTTVQDRCLGFNPWYRAPDKLGAQNIIDSNFNGMIITDFDDTGNADGVNPLGGALPLAFEGTTAPGDSGGPIIPVGFAPGAGTIVGVLSGGEPNAAANCVITSLYNDCSAWAPLSANQAFINLYVPEPNTSLLIGAGVLASAMLRRRKR